MAYVKDLHTIVGGPIDDDVTGSGHDEAAMSGTKLRTSDTAMRMVRKPSAMRFELIDKSQGGRRVVFSDIVVNLLKVGTSRRRKAATAHGPCLAIAALRCRSSANTSAAGTNSPASACAVAFSTCTRTSRNSSPSADSRWSSRAKAACSTSSAEPYRPDEILRLMCSWFRGLIERRMVIRPKTRGPATAGRPSGQVAKKAIRGRTRAGRPSTSGCLSSRCWRPGTRSGRCADPCW